MVKMERSVTNMRCPFQAEPDRGVNIMPFLSIINTLCSDMFAMFITYTFLHSHRLNNFRHVIQKQEINQTICLNFFRKYNHSLITTMIFVEMRYAASLFTIISNYQTIIF